ncbi:hypothetical protein GCM10010495_70980 [Kitasatospora herbaricolor]|nr:hypothetical protein GCM10010495_70980 [Kitasatospora herbaricolor]
MVGPFVPVRRGTGRRGRRRRGDAVGLALCRPARMLGTEPCYEDLAPRPAPRDSTAPPVA